MNLDDVLERINITGRSKTVLVGIPLALLALSLVIIAFNGVTLGTDLEGGTLVKVRNINIDADELQAELRSEFGTPDISVRSASGLSSGLTYIEAPADIKSSDLEAYLDGRFPDAELPFSVFNPTVSKQFQDEAMKAIIFAFIGMSIIVLIVFRTPIPSLAVVLSAASDISISVALMSIFGIKLTLGTIAALLMIIGYSVDSDILLTTRLIKRKGELVDKVRGAMKTGVTMTLTTLVAMIVLYVVSQNDTLDSIAIVLIFALVVDLINTWMLNTGILMWFLERQAPKASRRRRTA
jgi:preprotein translocase subunit SecF